MGLWTGIGAAAGGIIGAVYGGPPGAAAGVAAGGALGAGIDGQEGAREANSQNKDLAHENRNWLYSMSSTAFQRASADLKAAGLNPLLAAGAQASTPSSSPANMVNEQEGMQASAKSFGDAAMRSVEMKQQIKKQDAEIGLIDAQRKNAEAQTLKTSVDTAVARKGIPEAELKNEVYDIIRPGVKSLKEMFRTGPSVPTKQKNIRMEKP